jgi:hypothetical protein
MLSDRQRRRCAEIAGALDRGELSIWLENEPSLSVAEKALVWDLRQHVVAKRKRAAGKRTPAPKVDDLGPGQPDLDDWPQPDDDNDDGAPPEEEEPSKVCPMCRGTGRDKTGEKCSACDGTGRIAANVDDDDEEDEEARSFYGYIEDEE